MTLNFVQDYNTYETKAIKKIAITSMLLINFILLTTFQNVLPYNLNATILFLCVPLPGPLNNTLPTT